ncbi:hypothetical protein GJ496_005943 [Pomphorhynchus laevis]|nr:hypothetical protein GJ496_005943 [Pomphorhynchus laevis]
MDFAEQERQILSFWTSIDAFKTSNRLAKNRPIFTFYDGPPFATGLPHYGHILAGTVKDTVTRWAMQSGYQVNRRFGWDCHGLPVEHEVDKILKIQSPKDIEEKYGIAEYNRICKETAMRYTAAWKEQVTRMGRWIEFDDDYKTLYPWYMESVWWVFKEMFNKGLVYRGVKVMPYSTGCATPLSNFEANQNYKLTQDPSVFVAFPLKSKDASLVAWTTTPWTLPSNLALCVHPDKMYCQIQHNRSGRNFIVLESRVKYLGNDNMNDSDEYSIKERFPGRDLKGLEYVPPFDYFVGKFSNAFRVLLSDYVTNDVGTGVVHQAPYFGEDDYKTCIENNVISKDQQDLLACPLDACGKFTDPVVDYKGMYVKDADKEIIKDLDRKGILIRRSQIHHSYPYCWRSETPLIYRAVPSWFINAEILSKTMCELNFHSTWVPSNIQEGRFGNWLKDARDWCISRNRFWGNPIPIWVSEDFEELVCIGSLAELQELSGHQPDDLHRHSIDHITIPSQRPGHPPLRRIKEVFDCWFESGAMPFAQCHYPFGKSNLEFPADFVAEGVDQTRGWFYTLLVISTALFQKCPFKNVVITGIILTASGEKMSKRLKNYPDPMEVVEKYGADALRLYLVSSPAVKAECLKFREDGVRELQRDVFIPWTNALRFLLLNIQRYEKEESVTFVYDSSNLQLNNNLEQWILSFLNSNILYIRNEMSNYRLYNVCPCLLQFVEILTNWYIRLDRPNLRGELSVSECVNSLTVLYHLLMSLAHLMAPFTPFLAEYFYQSLKPYDSSLWLESDQSVHFRQIPMPNKSLINPEIEESVNSMRSVIETARTLRDKHKLPFKQALKELIVICSTSTALNEIEKLQSFIISEINVRKFTLTMDKNLYNVKIQFSPNFKKLGARAKSSMKLLAEMIKQMTETDYADLCKNGFFKFAELPDFTLEPDDVSFSYNITSASINAVNNLIAECSPDKRFICIFNVELSNELICEKISKEVCNRIQRLRKAAKLVPTDSIRIHIHCEPDDSVLTKSVSKNIELIRNLVKQCTLFPSKCESSILVEGKFDIEDGMASISIEKIHSDSCQSHMIASKHLENSQIDNTNTKMKLPVQPFVNIVLACSHIARKRYGHPITKGSLFLSPNLQSLNDFSRKICKLFGLQDCTLDLFLDSSLNRPVTSIEINLLQNSTIFAIESNCPNHDIISHLSKIQLLRHPFAKFINISHNENVQSIFIENPIGCRIESLEDLKERVKLVIGSDLNNYEMFVDSKYTTPVNFTDIDWLDRLFVPFY